MNCIDDVGLPYSENFAHIIHGFSPTRSSSHSGETRTSSVPLPEMQVCRIVNILAQSLYLLGNGFLFVSFLSLRRIVASASNILPHIPKENPKWTDPRLTELMRPSFGSNKSEAPETPDSAKDPELSMPLPSCQETFFVEPLGWMTEVLHQQQGKLNCPKCKTKLGSFSWIMG